MSIFGNFEPKIKWNDGFIVNELIIYHSKIIDKGLEFWQDENKSVLTNSRKFRNNGFYFTFTLLINLHKYDFPEQIYGRLSLAQNYNIVLFNHYDSSAIKDASGNEINFKIETMTTSFFESRGVTKDVLEVKFICLTPNVDIRKSLTI